MNQQLATRSRWAISFALVLTAGCDQSTAPPPSGEAAKAAFASEPTATAAAEPPAATPTVGDPAPAWDNLIGVDGKQHSLADLSDAKAVAVVFTCNHCPIAVIYEDRLIQLANDYADKPFKLVAVNVNNLESDKLPAMKLRAAEKGFPFQYLYDASQEIGRAYGATVTPHAFLIDAERKLAYMGAIDDHQNAAKVEQHYLRDAIDAVLAGNAPEKPKTQQFGCGIAYE